MGKGLLTMRSRKEPNGHGMRIYATILSLQLAGFAAQAQESAPATNPPPVVMATNESLPLVTATNLPPSVATVTNPPLRIIRAELLRTMLQRTNDFVLIDVMPRLYYQDFHIKGAMSIPEEALAETVRDWPRRRRIVVYCLDVECDTSRDAARELMAMGFTDVLQYEGGKREWHAKKYESIGKGKLLE